MTNCSVFLFILMFLWMFKVSKAEAEVSCVFMHSCILPCSFQSGSEDVVHWSRLTGRRICVHSFYRDKDQLEVQDQNFRGRTSLFRDQISRGNASLLLRGVKVQDQGRYACSTETSSTNKRSLINLKVEAPVTKVNVDQVENRITCSSEGLYPAPELTWSTRLSSKATLENTITVRQTEQQLYSISSSLIISDRVSALIYSCTIRTIRSRRKVTLFRQISLSVSERGATIRCSSSNLTATSLVWRFNHSQLLLRRTRTNHTVSEEWRKHLKEVSESGSLTLQDLSSNQEGVYTCELSDEEETMITNISLRIERHQGFFWIFNETLGIVFGAIFSAVTVVVLIKGCRK